MTGQIQLNITIFTECNGNNAVTAVLILTLLFDYKYFSLNAAKHYTCSEMLWEDT